MKLEELFVYTLAMEIADEVSHVVACMTTWHRSTVGRQLVRACDSIAANIAEGYGRYSFKENKQFCFYARGSLYETLTFIRLSHRRKAISDTQFTHLNERLSLLTGTLNNYIKSIGVPPDSLTH